MKVGYSKTYPVSVYWEKNWLEDEIPTGITLDSTDEEIEVIMKKVRRIQYALKKQVESFHYEALAAAEKQMGTHVGLVVDSHVDAEFENVIHELKRFEFREDAQAYLDTTSFRLTLVAKNIVNSIKSKK